MNLILLKLISAHLLAQVLIQPRDWLPGKAGQGFGLIRELRAAGAYAVIAYVLIVISGSPMGGVPLLALIAVTSAARFLLGFVSGARISRSWLGFLGMQAAQLAAICALASSWSDVGLPPGMSPAALDSPRAYGLLVTFIASLWLGGVLVRLVTALLPDGGAHKRVGMEGAGSIIGILERLLITSLIVFWPELDAAAIGLIFSAKSIARFPEMGKEDGAHFAEYYLVGSLTSFTVAIAAGLLARNYLPPF